MKNYYNNFLIISFYSPETNKDSVLRRWVARARVLNGQIPNEYHPSTKTDRRLQNRIFTDPALVYAVHPTYYMSGSPRSQFLIDPQFSDPPQHLKQVQYICIQVTNEIHSAIESYIFPNISFLQQRLCLLFS